VICACAEQGHEAIGEADIFSALERLHADKTITSEGSSAYTDDDRVTPAMKRILCSYLCAKALIGVITPGHDEFQKAAISKQSDVLGSVYFIPQDAHLETDISTRHFVEGHITVRIQNFLPPVGRDSCVISLLQRSLSCS
jgi:hypothetical protein